MVVSENFATGKSLGTGVGKIWYRKKYRYQKHLVLEKVSILFNILGTVTHCLTVLICFLNFYQK